MVIAIIAILAAMLLPALSAARERARNANCIAKLKQLGQAEFMYSSVNKDYTAVDDTKAAANADFISNETVAAETEDRDSADVAASPAEKLVMGGFMGMNLKRFSADAKEKVFKCPSDSAYDGTKTRVSYYKAILVADTTTSKKRVIVGRDNPNAAQWFDCHQGLGTTNSGDSTTGSNHPTTVNILYFGAHVGSKVIKTTDSHSVADKDAAGWKFLDDITY